MIKEIGDCTIRKYDILLSCALKSCGFSGDFATAAAIVNQIDYWLDIVQKNEASTAENERKHYKNGKWWVYNTYQSWLEQFPYTSGDTIKRIMQNLEKLGIVETGRFNQKGYDRTKWYSLNYKVLENLMEKEKCKLPYCNVANNPHSNSVNCTVAKVLAAPTNTKEYTKNTSKNTHKPESGKSNRYSFTNYGSNSEYSKMDSNDFEELEKILIEN